MENTTMKPEEIQIESLLKTYLRAEGNSNISTGGVHLDPDTLAAFTEGSLLEREASVAVGHLVNCSFCRHITADLIRLDAAFAEFDEPRTVVETAEPASVSSVLGNLLSKIFSTSDGAVFAHNEDEKDETEPKDEIPKD